MRKHIIFIIRGMSWGVTRFCLEGPSGDHQNLLGSVRGLLRSVGGKSGVCWGSVGMSGSI